MNVENIRKIFDFIESNKEELYPYFLDSYVADEFFFHSIIKYLMKQDKKIEIEDTITYVNWHRENSVLPVTFTSDDFQELINQPENKLFARKFNVNFDDTILDNLDEVLSNGQFFK